MTSETTTPGLWDRIGISLSGLCMVHCLLMPAVVAAVPLWSQAETLHDWLHPLLLLTLAPITVMALVSTRSKPQARRVWLLLGAGLLALALPTLFSHEAASPVMETAFTLLGSGLLITGHRHNGRICRRCVH